MNIPSCYSIVFKMRIFKWVWIFRHMGNLFYDSKNFGNRWCFWFFLLQMTVVSVLTTGQNGLYLKTLRNRKEKKMPTQEKFLPWYQPRSPRNIYFWFQTCPSNFSKFTSNLLTFLCLQSTKNILKISSQCQDHHLCSKNTYWMINSSLLSSWKILELNP